MKECRNYILQTTGTIYKYFKFIHVNKILCQSYLVKAIVAFQGCRDEQQVPGLPKSRCQYIPVHTAHPFFYTEYSRALDPNP